MEVFKKQGRLKALQAMLDGGFSGIPKGPTAEAVTPIGPLASLKAKEEKAARVPMSTSRGIKESLTKKIRPKGI